MKNIRLIALVLILIMCAGLCGCRSTNRYLESGLGNDDTAPAFSDNVTIAGQPVASEAAPAATEAPAATPTTAPTAAPTAAPTPTPVATSRVYADVATPGVLTITKSPTSETVPVGGKASFVAYASNFATMDWILVSPALNSDGIYQAYTALEAPNYFPGLVSTGTSSSTLILSNIPAELNGWKVQARFWASGSSTAKYTNAATIYILGASPAEPTSTPSSKATEAECRAYADNCHNYIRQYASALGYTVGEVTEFSYSSGIASFSVSISNSTYRIDGGFFATGDSDYGYYPAYACVYNASTGAPVSENIYGSTNDWQYYQALIDAYAVK